jgi:hypothetical protein
VGSSHLVCDEKLQPVRKAYGACSIPDDENYLTYGKGITAFATFKSSYYQITNGINPNFKRAVDQDLYYQLEEVGETVFIPSILYKYRVHSGGISSYENMAKARYWLVKAKEEAHERRKGLKAVKNITSSELRSWWSILYATKAGDSIRRLKICSALFWFSKAVLKSPLDRFWLLKIRSMLAQIKLKSRPG